jgi:peptide/nickel transport system substrate-binding protein
MKKRNLFTAAILSMFLIIAGCGSEPSSTEGNSSNNQAQTPANSTGDQKPSGPQKGGELTIAYDTDVSNYDPTQGNSGNDHALLYPVYDTLVTYNNTLEPGPGLAESWETPDEKTIILKLRTGVTFHDGTAFDAEAVKFNLDRANSAESKVSDLRSIESVEVVDPSTVKLNLKQPDSSIILALSDRSGMMVSPAAVEKFGADFAQNPVGTGPYKMVNWVRNGEIVFETNDKYWQEGLPYLDKLTVKIMPDENTRMNALKSGQVDFYWNVSPDNTQVLKNDKAVVMDSTMRVYLYNMYLNTKLAPFDKKEVRQALQFAINREALVKALTFDQGKPGYQSFPEGYWAAGSGLEIPYDPAKSKELLKQAGMDSVTFDMIVPASAFYQRLAEAIKGQVKEAGITINIQPMELTKGVALFFNEKEVPANLMAWTGRPDPQQTVNLFISGKGFYNTGQEATPEKEELITKAAASYDLKERAELYQKINEIAMLDEAMTIPIMFTPADAAMTPKVKGFEGSLLGKPRFSFLWLEQ